MKLPQKISAVTIPWWEKKVSPIVLFIFVISAFVIFLFQRNLAVLFAGDIIFFLLALTRKGKVKILPSLMMIIAITFFSLLTPYGKVLYRFGNLGFAITEGALIGGLRKGLILSGMIFLSQIAISKKLNLPGKIGRFVSKVFFYLDDLTNNKIEIKLKPSQIVSEIDRIISKVYFKED